MSHISSNLQFYMVFLAFVVFAVCIGLLSYGLEKLRLELDDLKQQILLLSKTEAAKRPTMVTHGIYDSLTKDQKEKVTTDVYRKDKYYDQPKSLDFISEELKELIKKYPRDRPESDGSVNFERVENDSPKRKLKVYRPSQDPDAVLSGKYEDQFTSEELFK